jgi:uncharacterized protein (TIGR03000 family)
MPVVVDPVEPKPALTAEQKLDLMLKGIEQMKKDGQKLNQKLLQLEEDLIKLKKALPHQGPKPGLPPGGKGAEETSASPLKDRTVFKVKLTAGAKLFIEGQRAESDGKSERVVVTPKLVPGAHYSYTFRADSIVDGISISQQRIVAFQAGQEIQVNLEFTKGIDIQ